MSGPVYHVRGGRQVYRRRGRMAVARVTGKSARYRYGRHKPYGYGTFEGVGAPVTDGFQLRAISGAADAIAAGIKGAIASVAFVGAVEPIIVSTGAHNGTGIADGEGAPIALGRKNAIASVVFEGEGAPLSAGTAHDGDEPLIDVLTTLGLTSGLRVCLDAGDGDSYTSGQSWLDTSGNDEDFFRGADGNATATDPTFNGTPNSLNSTNYWSFDGGDYFTLDTTNPTWVNNLHKDNALYTIAMWVRLPSFGVGVFGTAGSLGDLSKIGVQLFLGSSPSGQPALQVFNGSGSTLPLGASGANNVPAATWAFLAVSINEPGGAGASFFNMNGAVNTFNGAYTSPSASNASHTAQIAAIGNAQLPFASVARMGAVMVWGGTALTQANAAAVFNSTRGRFGV